ncbi:unnamed protein product [Euphydryas editha]|uniref:Uncharacterized protein n=1 Tax=Euphydryas editha TaxID=104508 RepID=A0AAU9UD98_EUPED|nr:unnamed protein product [Euphydryas editha]
MQKSSAVEVGRCDGLCERAGLMLASLARRELDAETPVVWPAWCYSAETGESNSREMLAYLVQLRTFNQTVANRESARAQSAIKEQRIL